MVEQISYFFTTAWHSSDLDLLLRAEERPAASQVADILTNALNPLSDLLHLGPLKTKILRSEQDLFKLAVLTRDDRTLFTVDLSRMGSVIESGIEERPLEALATTLSAAVKSVSRDHQLLQKAETFLLRKITKCRDAYDVKLLLDTGATLSGTPKQQLEDTLAWREIGSQDIRGRIESVTANLCRAELKEFLPEETYKRLEDAGFQPVRDALSKLFEDWL